MKMNLAWHDLRRSQELRLHETLSFPDLAKGVAQLVSLSPVDAAVRAQETSGICRVRGTLETRATFLCSRCVGDFAVDLSIPFDEQFVREELPEQRPEEEINIAPGETIELDPYIQQAILLALPYRPLCMEECKGICPDCGVNRNDRECSCGSRRIDPRLADLAKFFEAESGD
jgi:uncharacterized protein